MCERCHATANVVREFAAKVQRTGEVDPGHIAAALTQVGAEWMFEYFQDAAKVTRAMSAIVTAEAAKRTPAAPHYAQLQIMGTRGRFPALIFENNQN